MITLATTYKRQDLLHEIETLRHPPWNSLNFLIILQVFPEGEKKENIIKRKTSADEIYVNLPYDIKSEDIESILIEKLEFDTINENIINIKSLKL